jgi:hypothetical protein
LKILNAGFETPKIVTNVIDSHATQVTSNMNVDYNWKPTDSRDSKLWQNVEMNKYGNNFYESHTFETPAKYVVEDGTTIIHAPSNSELRIVKSTPTISNFGFLELTEDI